MTQQTFAQKLVGIYTGAVLTKLIDVGHRTGLFEAAAQGPATSAELAKRAGLQERYVREWLGAMACADIFTYDPSSGAFTFPQEHAALLTGSSAKNVAPQSQLIDSFAKQIPAVSRAFKEGGGVPYSEDRPDFTDAMDSTWRRIYDEQLITGFLGAVPGVTMRLAAGLRVADIGCGTGHAINLMADAYRKSDFTGYDLAEDAIARALGEAASLKLPNARFEVMDVTKLPPEPTFDLITAFDSIHDQVAPDTVLKRANQALAANGIFLMIDFKASSDLAKNLENPFSALYYGISTMHCMTVSLAHGGAGLGTMWGQELATKMLHEAGFRQVDVVDSPRPQNLIYVCRK